MAIRTRLLSAALLFHKGKVLLMEKQASAWQQQTEPFYSAIGGHMEPAEINDPLDACYREIEEETGLRREDLSELKLRYILHRLKKDEIRLQYIYVGETLRADVVESAEGELHWYDPHELDRLRLSFMLESVFKHYLNDPDQEHIVSGTMSLSEEGTPLIRWNPLIDPLVF